MEKYGSYNSHSVSVRRKVSLASQTLSISQHQSLSVLLVCGGRVGK